MRWGIASRQRNCPMKKIKVVFGINDFLVGGMQRQFIQQAQHYDREKFEIILITLFQFSEKEDLYAELPETVAVHKLAFGGWWDVGEWWKLYKLLRSLRPDIVVSSLFFSNTVFRLLKPLLGYASIAREHNTYVDKSWLQKSLDRLLTHFAYCIVAVSKTVADFTAKQENIPREKFAVIHNGIDLEQATRELAALPERDRLRQEMGLTPDHFVVLNVARLSAQKNHKLLIEGFAVFSSRHRDCKLLIVGDGALREELEAQARAAGAGASIVFVGHQTDTQPFYKLADVFISTSNIEGLSNSYLEALAAGLPLVSTKTAGTDELIFERKNGFFIQEATVDAVIESLEKIRSANIEELKKEARASLKNFDIRTTVQKYEELFEAVAN